MLAVIHGKDMILFIAIGNRVKGLTI